MPTGYTADVGDGTITEFADFAMQCARAFGALITMRDDPIETEIPQTFAPSDYHAKAIKEAEEEIHRLQTMTSEGVERAAAEDAERRHSEWKRYDENKLVTRERYQDMLAKVEAWSAPTPEHEGLKRFMIEQLTQSIEFDCKPSTDGPPQPVAPDDWYSEALAKAHRDVAYHAEEQAKEIKRARERTKWVSDLRASLKHD